MTGMFGGYQPEALPPLTVPQFPDQPKPKGGMFGGDKKMDWAGLIQSVVGGYLAGRGIPMGGQILSQVHQRQMMAQQQAMEQANYQRQRQDGMQDWIAKQEYEAAHPQPHVNDTVADYEFIRQQLGDEAAKRFIETKTNPIVMTPYGPMPYSSVTGGGQAPAKPVGKLIPIDDGGPTPQASGGFPRPY